jgi:SAM-dependent methyltransferase
MEKDEYRKHFELEESHWWFKGRRRTLLSVLRSRTKVKGAEPLAILDAGCGAGYNLKMFERFGTAFGFDYSPDALAYCRRRGLTRIARADINALPFQPARFNLVSLLDVLYHKSISDDVAVLKEIHGLLKEGGLVLVFDNAFKALRSPHDAVYHSRERYTKKSLKNRLEAAGFRPVRATYFNFSLFPILFLIRSWQRLRPTQGGSPQSDLKAAPRLVNALLYGILRLEAFLSRKISFPWGSSIVILARKE